MASKQNTVDYIVDQIAKAGDITSRKMFGEYGIYCDGKIVALVCDDQLYIKPTQAGRDYVGIVIEKPPYPGGKPYLWISGEQWDDADWMSELVRMSARELPAPKEKKSKKRA